MTHTDLEEECTKNKLTNRNSMCILNPSSGLRLKGEPGEEHYKQGSPIAPNKEKSKIAISE